MNPSPREPKSAKRLPAEGSAKWLPPAGTYVPRPCSDFQYPDNRRIAMTTEQWTEYFRDKEADCVPRKGPCPDCPGGAANETGVTNAAMLGLINNLESVLAKQRAFKNPSARAVFTIDQVFALIDFWTIVLTSHGYYAGVEDDLKKRIDSLLTTVTEDLRLMQSRLEGPESATSNF